MGLAIPVVVGALDVFVELIFDYEGRAEVLCIYIPDNIQNQVITLDSPAKQEAGLSQ